MTETITVRPAPGRRVLHPVTLEPLDPEAWTELERDTFVIRRLADGDLLQRPATERQRTTKGE